MELFIQIMGNIFNPLTLVLITLGTFFGILMGAVPGLNGAIAVALLLPFTFSLSPQNGLL